MGTAAEAAVYCYIGIALVSLIPTYWSFGFIFAELLLIIAGRIIGVFSSFFLFRLCCKSRTINIMELIFITYAGMIRGAIAFALVLTLPVVSVDDPTMCSEATIPTQYCLDPDTYSMLVSTTLSLVVLTTLCFGTFMSIVQKFLVSPSEEDAKEVEQDFRSKSIAESNAMRKKSIYEEIMHPNEEADEENEEEDGNQYDD